jgi:hypothetical protein
MKIDIYERALACLEESNIDKKIQFSNQVLDSCKNGFIFSEKPPVVELTIEAGFSEKGLYLLQTSSWNQRQAKLVSRRFCFLDRGIII